MPLGLAALHVSRAIAAERVCPSPTTFKQAGHRLWRLCPRRKRRAFDSARWLAIRKEAGLALCLFICTKALRVAATAQGLAHAVTHRTTRLPRIRRLDAIAN